MKIWQPLWMTIATILVVVVALVVVPLWQAKAKERRDRAKVERKIAELNQRAIALSAAELAKRNPDPTPAEDAGLLLGAALARVSGAPSLREIIDDPGSLVRTAPLPADLREVVAAEVERNRLALQAIPNTFPPEARVSHAWVSGLTNFLAQGNGVNLKQVRELNEALCLAAVESAEKGQGDEALGFLITQFRITHTFRNGTLVEYMMARAIEGRTCSTLERVLNRTQVSEVGMVPLIEELTRTSQGSMEVTVTIESAIGQWVFESQHARDDDTLRLIGLRRPAGSPIEAIGNWFFEWRPLKYDAEEHLGYLTLQKNLFDVVKLPPHQVLGRMQQWERRAAAESARNKIVAFAVPRWRKAAEIDLQTRSRLLASQVALAVERFRLAKQTLPETLADLIPDYLPAMPLDDFDNQPLRYRRLERGFVIYSVGPDTQDDTRGKSVQTIDEDTADDVRFLIER